MSWGAAIRSTAAALALMGVGLGINRWLSRNPVVRMSYADQASVSRVGTEDMPPANDHRDPVSAMPVEIAASVADRTRWNNGDAGGRSSGVGDPEGALSRLNRIQSGVEALWGPRYMVTLAGAGQTVTITADGIVEVDLSLVERMSDGAMIGMIAREAAESEFDGRNALHRSGDPGVDGGFQADSIERERRMDTSAGWAIGALGYPMEVLDELLMAADPLTSTDSRGRSSFRNETRFSAMRLGYEEGRRQQVSAGARSADAPAHPEVSHSPVELNDRASASMENDDET